MLFECLDDQGEIVSVSVVSFVFVVVSIDGMNLTRDLRRTPMTIHCKFSIRFFLLNIYFVLWYNLVINNIIRQYNKEFQCVYEDRILNIEIVHRFGSCDTFQVCARMFTSVHGFNATMVNSRTKPLISVSTHALSRLTIGHFHEI